MKMFNSYYQGENRSHCSSCWESDDEDVKVLLTTLTLDEIKVKLEAYCWSIPDGWEGYRSFFDFVMSESEDSEGNQVFVCMLLEIDGTSYSPEIQGHFLEDYDVEVYLKLEDIKGIKEIELMWEKGRKKREEEDKVRRKKEKEEDKIRERNAEKQRKYQAKKKEFEDYQELKEKWEGKTLPPKPKDNFKKKVKLDLGRINKFLQENKEKRDEK